MRTNYKAWLGLVSLCLFSLLISITSPLLKNHPILLDYNANNSFAYLTIISSTLVFFGFLLDGYGLKRMSIAAAIIYILTLIALPNIETHRQLLLLNIMLFTAHVILIPIKLVYIITLFDKKHLTSAIGFSVAIRIINLTYGVSLGDFILSGLGNNSAIVFIVLAVLMLIVFNSYIPDTQNRTKFNSNGIFIVTAGLISLYYFNYQLSSTSEVNIILLLGSFVVGAGLLFIAASHEKTKDVFSILKKKSIGSALMLYALVILMIKPWPTHYVSWFFQNSPTLNFFLGIPMIAMVAIGLIYLGLRNSINNKLWMLWGVIGLFLLTILSLALTLITKLSGIVFIFYCIEFLASLVFYMMIFKPLLSYIAQSLSTYSGRDTAIFMSFALLLEKTMSYLQVTATSYGYYNTSWSSISIITIILIATIFAYQLNKSNDW